MREVLAAMSGMSSSGEALARVRELWCSATQYRE